MVWNESVLAGCSSIMKMKGAETKKENPIHFLPSIFSFKNLKKELLHQLFSCEV